MDPEQSLLQKYYQQPSVAQHLHVPSLSTDDEYRATSPMLTIDDYHWFMKRYRYVDLVNEHYKEPGIEMFNDMTTSVIRALVSDESESNVEVDVAK